MASTLADMAQDHRFPHEQVFDQTLPKCTLRGNAHDKLEQAIERSILENNSENIFVDTSGSKGRRAEVGYGVTTCIRPSHPIFSVRLGRYLTVAELLKCQGIFKDDFEHPGAIDQLLAQSPAKAQDLAGNAFSSTVAQVQLLASLVHAEGWKNIGGMPSNDPDPLPQAHQSADALVHSLPSDSCSSQDIGDAEVSRTCKKRQVTDYFDSTPVEKRQKFTAAPAAAKFEAHVFVSMCSV